MCEPIKTDQGLFTVHMMKTYLSWENVEAASLKLAIEKCRMDPVVVATHDGNELVSWEAFEQEADD